MCLFLELYFDNVSLTVSVGDLAVFDYGLVDGQIRGCPPVFPDPVLLIGAGKGVVRLDSDLAEVKPIL